MNRTYNTFFPGVQQDDFLTNGANFIEHKNLDGLRDGYGITLGPKVNKSIISTEPMRAIIAFQLATLDTDRLIYAGEDGKIYNGGSDTAIYTLSNGGHVLAVVELVSDYYFFYKTNIANDPISVAKVSRSHVWAGTITGNIDETYKTGEFSHRGCPPIIELNNKLYIGDSSSVKTMDSAGTITSFSFPDDYVVGITKHNAVLTLYCRSGSVYMWDGIDTTWSGIQDFGARISKVTQKKTTDYVTTEDGQFFIAGGLQFERITKPKKSKHMNDNSSFDTRLSFALDEPNNAQNRIITVAGDDEYIYSNDTIKGIYKYGKLIPGMQDGLHKIITQNHLGTDIDYIYDMYYYERIKHLYFSYKAGSTYGVDYIDLDSLETCTDGYGITDVFSGGTSLKKKINKISQAVSNTSGSNYIKLYYRVNNGSWEEIRNFNETTDTIERFNITNIGGVHFKEYVDVQFKIELHNDNGGEDVPIVHELDNDYEVIKT